MYRYVDGHEASARYAHKMAFSLALRTSVMEYVEAVDRSLLCEYSGLLALLRV